MGYYRKQQDKTTKYVAWVTAFAIAFSGGFFAKGHYYAIEPEKEAFSISEFAMGQTEFDLTEVPSYDGEPSVEVNGNVPYYENWAIPESAFEYYSNQDALGRCEICVANIGEELMPTESRKDISHVKPTGWNQKCYPEVIEEDGYLYNRCHLIAFCLAGENDNQNNLITGTGYMNCEGMFPYECEIWDYVMETNNHVLYRVTPVYEGDNLMVCGVLLEARSVEDDGEGLEFCVFCYNVQPGVVLDYADGASYLN